MNTARLAAGLGYVLLALVGAVGLSSLTNYYDVSGLGGLVRLAQPGYIPYFLLVSASLLLLSFAWMFQQGPRLAFIATGVALLAAFVLYTSIAFLPSFSYFLQLYGGTLVYTPLSFVPVYALLIAGLVQVAAMLLASWTYREVWFAPAALALLVSSIITFLVINVWLGGYGEGLLTQEFGGYFYPTASELASAAQLAAGVIAAYCFFTPSWGAPRSPSPKTSPSFPQA